MSDASLSKSFIEEMVILDAVPATEAGTNSFISMVTNMFGDFSNIFSKSHVASLFAIKIKSLFCHYSQIN
jgi:hypothetical protein